MGVTCVVGACLGWREGRHLEMLQGGGRDTVHLHGGVGFLLPMGRRYDGGICQSLHEKESQWRLGCR